MNKHSLYPTQKIHFQVSIYRYFTRQNGLFIQIKSMVNPKVYLTLGFTIDLILYFPNNQ